MSLKAGKKGVYHEIVDSIGMLTEKAFETAPKATSSKFGFIKVGTGLQASSGVVSIKKATTDSIGGVISGDGLRVDSDGELSLSPASTEALGGIIVGSGLSIDTEGVLNANVPAAAEWVKYVDNSTISGTSSVDLTPGSAIEWNDLMFVVTGNLGGSDSAKYIIVGYLNKEAYNLARSFTGAGRLLTFTTTVKRSTTTTTVYLCVTIDDSGNINNGYLYVSADGLTIATGSKINAFYK